MKIWKSLSGFLSILIAALIALLFLFADLLELLANPLPIETPGSPGAAGAILAVALAFGGIITLATRSGGRGGSIAAAILYGVGGVVGLVLAEGHGELRLCAGWALLCMVAAMVDIGTTEPIQEEDYDDESDEDYPEPEPEENPDPAVPAAAPAPARRPAKPIPATLQQVLTEEDPWKRNAAIDALPEKQAKSYLKQVLNTFVGRDGEDPASDALVRTLIVVLAIIGLALVGIVAVGIFGSMGIGPAAGLAQPSAAQSGQVSTAPEASQNAQATVNPIPGSGTLGDYHVEIKEAFLTTDYQGNPAAVVTYTWTNNGQEAASAMAELVDQAFQSGAELSAATITASQRYETGTKLREVQPGEQADVQCVFHLESVTAPIEFQVSEFLGGSGTVVYASFDPDTLTVEQ